MLLLGTNTGQGWPLPTGRRAAVCAWAPCEEQLYLLYFAAIRLCCHAFLGYVEHNLTSWLLLFAGYSEIRYFVSAALKPHPCSQHCVQNEALLFHPQRQRQHALVASAVHVTALSLSFLSPDAAKQEKYREGNAAQSKCLVQWSFLGVTFWYGSIVHAKLLKQSEPYKKKKKKDPLKSRLIEWVLTLVRQMSDMQQACGFSSKVKCCFLHNGMINTLKQEY